MRVRRERARPCMFSYWLHLIGAVIVSFSHCCLHRIMVKNPQDRLLYYNSRKEHHPPIIASLSCCCYFFYSVFPSNPQFVLEAARYCLSIITYTRLSCSLADRKREQPSFSTCYTVQCSVPPSFVFLRCIVCTDNNDDDNPFVYALLTTVK